MRHASLAAALPCPIARTLEIVGEWWSLLIIRDAVLGARRFDEFKRSGISDNILSTRLKTLTDAHIFKRVRYQTSPDRYEYVLTEKGQELGPVVLALRSWGRPLDERRRLQQNPPRRLWRQRERFGAV
jgi:DNA-binding HxlR family transcriptional regulator